MGDSVKSEYYETMNRTKAQTFGEKHQQELARDAERDGSVSAYGKPWNYGLRHSDGLFRPYPLVCGITSPARSRVSVKNREALERNSLYMTSAFGTESSREWLPPIPKLR
jgi:hypothetical protein